MLQLPWQKVNMGEWPVEATAQGAELSVASRTKRTSKPATSRKQEPQLYNHKEMASTPKPHMRISADTLFQPAETLSRESVLITSKH